MLPTLETIYTELKQLQKLSAIAVKDNLTVNEASVYMGISERKVREILKAKEMAYWKPNGKLIWVPKDECNKWIRRNKSESADTIKMEAERIIEGLKKKRA